MPDWRPVQIRVLRPTEAESSRGQTQGTPNTIYESIFAKMRTLSGRELVQARTVFAEAQHELDMYADPAKPVFERDYIDLIGKKGPDGKTERRLSVIFKNDVRQNGERLMLTCGERTGG